MLKEQLLKDIEQEGLSKASDFGYDPGSEGYYDLKIAYERGASKYAALWQAAEEKAARYEKALKLIAQMSDPGDHWVAVTRMKSIASDALTSKTTTNE